MTKISAFILQEKRDALSRVRTILVNAKATINAMGNDDQADHQDKAAALRAMTQLEGILEACE